MTYQVKEIYFTLQGEGAHTGRGAVLLPLRRLQPLDRP
jgi:organic radical activating enzyme